MNGSGCLVGRIPEVERPESLKNKKTGLLSQRMTQKPGEFSDSVLLEDYGDHPTSVSTIQLLEIFPGYKEQFQLARLQTNRVT